ncbi:NAD(P)/FAD-dependent oxidoreductase [uncultured Acidaminococcus sp.]|uniref:NAD(P)/FAD-dependent oxidoreductase n=1 Tax=uncultured Acidaminococcus sp. TaxID=352152 RepID=UPI0026702BE3|nr:FAD-dependent oxidoreductase [uncultured Acidaminococcus sp.]
MLYDIAIVGGGPAGCSAAVTAANRSLSALLLDTGDFGLALRKSALVKNYLGMPDRSGAELMDAFTAHMKAAGTTVVPHKVLSILPREKHFYLATPGEVYEARSILLCPGASHGKPLEGETAMLGKGVTYCATCDGYLYRGKTIGVVTNLPSAWEEVEFLAGVAGEVKLWADFPLPEKRPANVQTMEGKPRKVLGEERVEALETTAGTEKLEGLFLLRETDPLDRLLPGLRLDGPFIRVDDNLATSVEGVFAAGDAVGYPWQINKAAGEGQKALLSAASWLRENPV